MTGYLSKSDFQVASACPTKLFYRKQGYPCTNGQNDYLEFLADGGYMENGECLVNLLVRQDKAGMAEKTPTFATLTEKLVRTTSASGCNAIISWRTRSTAARSLAG
jgi:hypothetical protein